MSDSDFQTNDGPGSFISDPLFEFIFDKVGCSRKEFDTPDGSRQYLFWILHFLFMGHDGIVNATTPLSTILDAERLLHDTNDIFS